MWAINRTEERDWERERACAIKRKHNEEMGREIVYD